MPVKKLLLHTCELRIQHQRMEVHERRLLEHHRVIYRLCRILAPCEGTVAVDKHGGDCHWVDAAEGFDNDIAGFGFDAEVIYCLNYDPSHFLGLDVYKLSLLKALFSHKPTAIQVSAAEDFEFNGEVLMVIAAICQYNGSGVREAKHAVPDDGLLDLIVVPKTSVLKVIGQLKNIKSGDHIDKIQGTRVIRTTEVDITSEELFRGEVEGELLIPGNYHIELIPNALNVLTAR